MAMWHCPNCGAPQAETARCWVCRRSSTTCSTCRHFRTSLAADVGYCSLDRRRRPLTGLELRGCWTGRPGGAEAQIAPGAEQSPTAGARRGAIAARGFVPVDELEPPSSAGPVLPAPIVLLGDPIESWEMRTSLFGEPER